MTTDLLPKTLRLISQAACAEGVQEAILRVAQRAMYDDPREGPGPGGSPKVAAKLRA